MAVPQQRAHALYTVIFLSFFLSATAQTAGVPDLSGLGSFTVNAPGEKCTKHPFTGPYNLVFYADYTISLPLGSKNCNLPSDVKMTTLDWNHEECTEVPPVNVQASGGLTSDFKGLNFRLSGTKCRANATRYLLVRNKCQDLRITFSIRSNRTGLCTLIKNTRNEDVAISVFVYAMAGWILVLTVAGCLACCIGCRRMFRPIPTEEEVSLRAGEQLHLMRALSFEDKPGMELPARGHTVDRDGGEIESAV